MPQATAIFDRRSLTRIGHALNRILGGLVPLTSLFGRQKTAWRAHALRQPFIKCNLLHNCHMKKEPLKVL